MKQGITVLFAVLVAIIILLSSILVYQWVVKPEKDLILATTTSTYDSGFLEYMLPVFEEKYNAKVRVLSVGTGQALEIASRGDADVVLVHSPETERIYVKSGDLIHRVPIMYNDFIVVGPPDDPANIKGLKNVTEVFIRITEAGEAGKIVFFSRGDDSGTHKKELSIWGMAEINPINRSWYLETGQGMGNTLIATNEGFSGKNSYTLTDRGTWLSMKDSLDNLVMLMEGDPVLINPYSGLLVNLEKHPKVNFDLAKKLIEYFISDYGQQRIANFTVRGEQLFVPCYGNAPDAWGTEEEEQVAYEYWGQPKFDPPDGFFIVLEKTSISENYKKYRDYKSQIVLFYFILG